MESRMHKLMLINFYFLGINMTYFKIIKKCTSLNNVKLNYYYNYFHNKDTRVKIIRLI